MLAEHHRRIVLVLGLSGFYHLAETWPLRVVGCGGDAHCGGNSIAGENRVRKAQPLVAIGHGMRINDGCCQTDTDCKRHGAVRDSGPERLGLAELFIHVMGEIVSAVPSVNNDVSLADRPPECLAGFSDHILFEIPWLFQTSTPNFRFWRLYQFTFTISARFQIYNAI